MSFFLYTCTGNVIRLLTLVQALYIAAVNRNVLLAHILVREFKVTVEQVLLITAAINAPHSDRTRGISKGGTMHHQSLFISQGLTDNPRRQSIEAVIAHRHPLVLVVDFHRSHGGVVSEVQSHW